MVDGKKCNCNLASVGSKKDTNGNKKRSLDGADTEATSSYDYSAYTSSYDKRQRTDTSIPPQSSYPMTVPADLSQQNYSYSMYVNASLTAIYNELQIIKYEMGNISQVFGTMKSTMATLKNELDSLCARHGIVPPPSTTFQ